MKTIKLWGVMLALVLVGACTDDFEEINRDPNNPTEVPTSYLLTHAQRGLKNIFNTNGSLYAQLWAETQYTNTSRYETPDSDFSQYYRGSQPNTGTSLGGLSDLQEIIRLNTDEETMTEVQSFGSNSNQIAVARILKAWTFHQLTDIWGDIPYSEALQGREIFLPIYDHQKDIYPDLIKELDEATAQINTAETGVVGDVIYGGNMAKWKLFAQSLKMRIGMRMSAVAPEQAQAAITSALGSGVFTSNDDNAIFANLADAANDNTYFQHFLTRTDYAISNELEDYMSGNSDPRLPIYASPTGGTLAAYAKDASTDLAIAGMPYGVSAADAGSITNASISFPGATVRSATSPSLIMTYPEVLFIQAEAAARGWVGGNAQELYEQAIRASMEFWDAQAASTDFDAIYKEDIGEAVSGVKTSLQAQIAPEEIAAYLTQPGVAFNQATALQQIGEQKWVALYMQGLQAWAEWRRTGYPELAPAPAAVEGRAIPRRRAYAQIESDLNKANYDEAVARLSEGNTMESRMWWDVEN
ncbi:SusD/RagB family nutrient-binding outer membrane lipoprotein [Tunicatimonas pelagia]|uniref:SusD/RagB family nutrient-binding outer membrane lipoprotein n=1 Tax=Tunicatimonas pelagia TaxID=931531 RepID=UPI0026670394|nr:SusD/RagB family nutrient-binding outer membrane lipoprotein [Tunicatimonas pelagia]WKN45207.1 SusD/RagB family nutrient-binding outer membrane lipoprotein [Tunicatimonas pelagia]